MDELDLNPPDEVCPEGFTFYELRPYFAETHYGTEPLPLAMASHMETCSACRERWQFLLDTDPRMSEAYWQEIEDLSRELKERARRPVFPEQPALESFPLEINNLISNLADLNPTVEQVYEVWQAVRAIEDSGERQGYAAYLADTSNFVLEQRGETARALRFLKEIENGPAHEPLELTSATEALAIAGCEFTASVSEALPMEIRKGAGRIYPDEFQRAKELYDLYERRRLNVPIKT